MLIDVNCPACDACVESCPNEAITAGDPIPVKVLRDFQGVAIRLTDERRAHILEHPEMAPMEGAIEETLLHPERVVQSFSDPNAHLYYRFYFRTIVGGKYLCVVVKSRDDDAFVLTAHLTDRIKKGVALWPTPNAE